MKRGDPRFGPLVGDTPEAQLFGSVREQMIVLHDSVGKVIAGGIADW